MPEKILVTLSTFAEYASAPLDLLRTSGFPFLVNPSGKRISTAELIDLGRDATVVIAGVEPYDVATLDRLPALKCISRCGAGVDSVDLNAARERGIAVVNTPDVPTRAVAEMTLTLMLALLRNLTRQARLVQQHKWSRLEAHLLSGRKVGLIGLGRIGRRVAELLNAFGASVCAHDPLTDPTWAQTHDVALVPLEQLLPGCDILSLHAAKTAAHPLFFGEREFGMMKRGALFLNLARGNMLDVAALHAALASGHLGGAGLDVYPEEPYQGPLCDLDNVVLTPHSATLTVETRVAMEVECVDKALRWLRGELRFEERVA